MAKKSTSPDADERKALLDYIKALDPDTNFIMIGSQLKRMAAEGMTYAGIRYALWYSINVEGAEYKGIGIVPYIYDRAKRYWQWRQQMKAKVAGWTPADEEAVVVKRQRDEEAFT